MKQLAYFLFKNISKILFLLIFSKASVAQEVKKINNDAAEKNSDQIKFPQASQFAKSKFEYKITSALNNTFGYDIISDGKVLIHQKNIPGQPGNEGFKSKEAATKVAQLVISKIKDGQMPPTVDISDLKKLKVTH